MTRELAAGVYETTASFTAIPAHACVCFKDDLGLVATTGPAQDAESQRYADLFAAAPELLNALKMWQAIHEDFNAMLEARADDESIVATLDGRMDIASGFTEVALRKVKGCRHCGDPTTHPEEARDICPTYEKFFDDAIDAQERAKEEANR